MLCQQYATVLLTQSKQVISCMLSAFMYLSGFHKNLNGSCDMITPFSERLFAVCKLALATINLHTKFEISIHYKDMKGDTKCQKWGI